MKRYISLLMTLAVSMSLTASTNDVEIVVKPHDENYVEIGVRRKGSQEAVEEGVEKAPLLEQSGRILDHGANIQELGESAGIVTLPYDYYSYAGYDHYAMYFSDNCKIIQIEDESQWKVAGHDVHITLSWATGDVLAIYPNTSWFRSFDYYIVNRTTGQRVQANMYQSPVIGSAYTKYVTGVDTYYDMVYLSDGTRWELSWSDSSMLRKWLVGDLIIVGMNEGWTSSSYPAVLINVNMNEYAYVRMK